MRQTARVVGNSDVTFVIHSDGEKLGELLISRGTVDWWPAHSKTRRASLSWEQFARLMETTTT